MKIEDAKPITFSEKKCPNPNCPHPEKGMDNLSRSVDATYVNHVCHFCGCHYCGDPKNPKFFSKKAWDDYVNEKDSKEIQRLTILNGN